MLFPHRKKKMKSDTEPRRVYIRNGVLHALFNGAIFAPKGETKIGANHAVRIEQNEDGTVTVKKRSGHSKTVREIWHPITRDMLVRNANTRDFLIFKGLDK